MVFAQLLIKDDSLTTFAGLMPTTTDSGLGLLDGSSRGTQSSGVSKAADSVGFFCSLSSLLSVSHKRRKTSSSDCKISHMILIQNEKKREFQQISVELNKKA
jgi:hypothetical protein